MKLYEAVGACLTDERVDAVFGLMGDGNLKLIPHLVDERRIPFYGARHESGAVAMADGYARSTGAVGVCTFTQGPGLTNALTALVTAQRGRTPMVVLGGDTPTGVPGLPQDIDQGPLWAAAGVAVQELTLETAREAVVTAFQRARTERRPVALNLPTDLQEQECRAEWRGSPTVSAASAALDPADAALTEALAAVSRARRPVVLAGRGAVAAGDRDDLVALADHIGALLTTSLPAHSWFRGHPFDVGIAGGFSSDLARRLLGEADCVLAFGASLNHFTSRGGQLFAPEAAIVQIDTDPTAFRRYTKTDIGVVGEAGAVARTLRERLAPSAGSRSPALAEEIATARATLVDESGSDGIDPRVLSRRIDESVAPGRTLVVDGGHFMGFPSMEIAVHDPSHYVFTLDFGSIGLGLGAAIGAAVAHPDRVTIAAVGDGGLMMSLGELDTAVRYGLPIVVLVYNDEAYGAEMHFLRMSHLADAESRFATPPLDAIARAMGAEAHPVATLDDLDALRPRLADVRGPMLLDCRITDRVRAGWLEEAFQRGTH